MPEGIREVSATGVSVDHDGVQPKSQVRQVAQAEGTRLAAAGAEFIPENCQGRKVADGAACSARPMKGTMLCVGHTRRAANA